jgi:alpha-tubulin suppressor-like RCC1 family protein
MRARSFALALLVFGCVDRGEVLGPLELDAGTPTNGGAGGDSGKPVDAVISSIAVGTSHSLAVSSGRLYAWGLNDAGQLGLGDTVGRHVPTPLASDIAFASVTAGGDYSCALDEVGAVYCFGANDRGQLGQGDRLERHAPARVVLPVAARALSSNFEHACALLADATLYCWGSNFEGELGQNDSPPSSKDTTADDFLSPVQVPGGDWSYVSAGDGATCGIRFDGTLWCWGRNTGYQLGGASTDAQVRHPLQVGTDTDWLRVESGQQFSFALKREHSLWAWGTNVARDATGDGNPLGTESDVLEVPTRLGSASDWVAVAVRVFHTCAVNRASELWCWGRNIEGQLGTGDTSVRDEPTRVATSSAEVAVSWFNTCARSNSGHVLCTGKNEDGEIGDGTTERPLLFTDVTPRAD